MQKVSYADLVRYRMESLFPKPETVRNATGLRGGLSSPYHVYGQYHAKNVGDLSLGRAIGKVLGAEGCLRLIDGGFSRSADTPQIILGGGSILTKDVVVGLQKVGVDPRKVSAIGVDFWGLMKSWPKHIIDYVGHFNHLHLRSFESFRVAKQVFESYNVSVSFGPDNAFSLFHNLDRLPEPGGQRRSGETVGINMLPHLHRLEGRMFVPGGGFASKLSTQYNVHRIADNYVQIFRDIVARLCSEGVTVLHIPFAIEDHLFATSVLRGMDVRFCPYSTDPSRVAAEVASVDRMIATRYHATVFSLALGIPIFVFAYAAKSESLATYLQLPMTHWVKNSDLDTVDPSPHIVELGTEPGFSLSESVRRDINCESSNHLVSILNLPIT